MKKYRLKISRQDFEELRQLVLADMPNEAAAFALAGVAEYGNQVDILVRRPVAIPKFMSLVQNEIHLEISPQAISGLAGLCEANKLGAVVCHSHPEGLHYSPSDDFGEGRLAQTLRPFIPSRVPVVSLLFTPDQVTGRIWLEGCSKPVKLDEIVVIGHYVQRIPVGKSTGIASISQQLYDRQVKAFGEEGQRAISLSHVGIIGVGGTGSAVAEQLVRLGVSDFLLIDPDQFSPSNLTRVYGSQFGSVWKSFFFPQYKVNMVAKSLKKINPHATVHALHKSVVLTDAATSLLDRDILFLCTDEHWGRSIVNQITYQYLIPTINMGVRITSDNGAISHAAGCVDVLRPNEPCLWCKQSLRADRIAAESLPPEERKLRLQEGYVEGIDSKTPSVISFTTAVASSAVGLLLQYLTNFMGEAGKVSRINHDFLTGDARRGTTIIDGNCICRKVKGFGDLAPIPTLAKISTNHSTVK
jgi:molybdopterin/thiamine biosynthesis adenylyltransferase